MKTEELIQKVASVIRKARTETRPEESPVRRHQTNLTLDYISEDLSDYLQRVCSPTVFTPHDFLLRCGFTSFKEAP